MLRKLETKVKLLKESHAEEVKELKTMIKDRDKDISALIDETITQENKLTEMEESISQFITKL